MQVLHEIYHMEQNIAVLKQVIADKEAPLRVAHTRLDMRSRRPIIELCGDPAQLRYAHSAVYVCTCIL